MVEKELISLCKRFCNIIAPSGYESSLANEIATILQKHGYIINNDAIGNLVCVKQAPSNKAKKIAFIAHMDSAPIIINGIDNNNIYWGSLSTWKHEKINNQSITFLSGTTGIAHHNDGEKSSNTISDIVGHIEIGDVGVLTPFFQIEEDIISATFLDDRVGCAVLVDIAKKIEESPIELSFIFTAQEEIGNKGAYRIAQHFDFDEIYIIDTTRTLSQEYKDPIYAIMGNGGCVKICDGFGFCSKELVKKVENIAKTNKIPLQREVIFRGGSDVCAFSRGCYNALFLGLSIPCINMHSRHEQICIKDMLAIKKTIIEILKSEQCDVREI